MEVSELMLMSIDALGYDHDYSIPIIVQKL